MPTPTPTILPKPAAEPEEIAIPPKSIVGAKLSKFIELQRLRETTLQMQADIQADIRERRREEERRHQEALNELAEMEREVMGLKPSKPRRASMPKEELEKKILEALKGGESSGNTIAVALSVDPNRVTATLDEMVKAKRVIHNGKEKKASRFSLPK